MSTATDKWIPVARGKLYCSPGCGAGCTKKQHDEALAAAEKLAESLGSGWKPSVWENLKWHAKVERGNLRVDIHPTMYGVYYNVTVHDLDGKALHWVDDKDARQGIEMVVRAARARADDADAAARLARANAGPPIKIKDPSKGTLP